MKCIYCGSDLAAIDYCPRCGADVTLLKRIGRISNLLYNRALEKASVRDLSGAISLLGRSLKFNKENIDARNLLGLCYFETGEVVLALTEWVISRNIRAEDNLAESYMQTLQGSKNQLDAINQCIRKYNQSITYCHDGHEDMAIMQLRKVVSSNPKYVAAQQLLALLYIKNQDYEKARRVLRRALSVDNTNTTTLRYLSEIEEITGRTSAFRRSRRDRDDAADVDAGGSTLRYISGTETIIQPTTFRDSSTVATFINIGLGILLGGAIVWFMAVPATRQRANDLANQAVTDANLKLASGSAQLDTLQDEIDGYKDQVTDANRERDTALQKAADYEELISVADMYVQGQQAQAVEALAKLDESLLDEGAKTLYDDIKANAGLAMFNSYYNEGTTAYVGGDYNRAAEQLKLAVESDPEGTDINYSQALYYLGFAYFNLGDTENADKYFQMYMEKYPAQAGTVSPYLSGGAYSAGQDTASQGEASMNADQGTGDITIFDNYTQTDGYTNTQPTYDESLVAWTDPNTGLHYDMYGNLLG